MGVQVPLPAQNEKRRKLFLLFSYVHLCVVAGGLFVFLFIFSEVIYYLNPKSFYSAQSPPFSKEILIKLIVISLISFAVLMINPNGINTYIYAYSQTKMKMLGAIQEWLSPFSPLVESTIVITLYKVLLFSGVKVLYYAYKKRELMNPFTAVTNIKQFENNIKLDPNRAKDELKRKTDSEPQGYFYGGMNEIFQKVLGK